ncbi:hypothetical protein ACM46_08110 [Chryseobacterium angstadtii]|uniref:Uncharacterized protein n=2 Tax=Chryseobacterium angstadtii TaxID=558151 RepID=A0A0J7IIJ6_9FLAO|nr:hypothetical protein ACM46_08110 [Chryseobacterium angstadtii]
MLPQEKGRFCSSCSKCVIDFTEKKPEEIESIFKERQEENICGRFYNYQLGSKTEKSEKLKRRFLKSIPLNFQNNRIALSIISIILFLTGCSKPKEEACATTTGVVVMEEDSLLTNDQYVMGEMKIENDSVAKIHQKDSLKSKHQKKIEK